MFEGEGFEVEAVAGVVVGGHGLGVAVDHDGLDAFAFEGISGVTAAVIELNSLPDAVRTGAENHDLFAIRRFGFAGSFVGGVEVGGEALEFSRAGIDTVEDGGDTELLAAGANVGFLRVPEAGHQRIGHSGALGLEEKGFVGTEER